MPKFTIRFSETITRTGSVEIETDDEDMARELAEDIPDTDIDWDDDENYEREPGRQIMYVDPTE